MMQGCHKPSICEKNNSNKSTESTNTTKKSMITEYNRSLPCRSPWKMTEGLGLRDADRRDATISEE